MCPVRISGRILTKLTEGFDKINFMIASFRPVTLPATSLQNYDMYD
jgi:hypothetical protein